VIVFVGNPVAARHEGLWNDCGNVVQLPMPTVRSLRVTSVSALESADSELNVLIYSTSGEKSRMDELYGQLRALGFRTPLRQKNPVTYDWVLVSDFLRDHATAMGAGLAGLLGLWIKQRKGRRIEVQRPDLKIKVATVRELEKSLAALHQYDRLKLTLNEREPDGPRKRKSPPGNRGSKSS